MCSRDTQPGWYITKYTSIRRKHSLSWFTLSTNIIPATEIGWSLSEFGGASRKVDVRLPENGNSHSHGARPVHLIKWIRTSRLSIKNSLTLPTPRQPCMISAGKHALSWLTLSTNVPPDEITWLLSKLRSSGGIRDGGVVGALLHQSCTSPEC